MGLDVIRIRWLGKFWAISMQANGGGVTVAIVAVAALIPSFVLAHWSNPAVSAGPLWLGVISLLVSLCMYIRLKYGVMLTLMTCVGWLRVMVRHKLRMVPHRRSCMNVYYASPSILHGLYVR